MAGIAATVAASDTHSARDAFLEEIALLTAGSGRWIADNAEYVSEQEPYDAYGTEWQSSFGGTILSGRLFGVTDGEETGTFWEFRQYWHPGRQVVVVEQFGGASVIGIGTAWVDDGRTHTLQTFYAGDGSTQNQIGHRSHFPDAQTHVTESYDVVDDEWILRRSYTWRRASE